MDFFLIIYFILADYNKILGFLVLGLHQPYFGFLFFILYLKT